MNMEIISKKPDEIAETALEMKKEGYRLVVITCTNAEKDYDITYTFESPPVLLTASTPPEPRCFDRNHILKHFRLTVPEETSIPSIGDSYSCAFVYENEIHDLYGFTFTNMSLDYQGTFIRTSVPFPFKKKEVTPPTITKVSKEEDSS